MSERRIARMIFCGCIGSPAQEKLHKFNAGVLYGEHKSGATGFVRDIWIRPQLEKGLRCSQVVPCRRETQRRLAATISVIDIGAGLYQFLNRHHVTITCSDRKALAKRLGFGMLFMHPIPANRFSIAR